MGPSMPTDETEDPCRRQEEDANTERGDGRSEPVEKAQDQVRERHDGGDWDKDGAVGREGLWRSPNQHESEPQQKQTQTVA